MEYKPLVTIEHVADPTLDRWVVCLNLSGLEPGDEIILGHIDKRDSTRHGGKEYIVRGVRGAQPIRDTPALALTKCARHIVRARMGEDVGRVAPIQIPIPATPGPRR